VIKKQNQWPFYYGWMIVLLAFLSTGVWLAMRTTFSVFFVALLDEFHWSRAATAGVQSVSFIVYTFAAPLTGWLIDRFGPRRVILPGILVLCAGLFLSAYVGSLLQLYLFFGVVVAFGVTFISIIAYSAVLSHWFERKRGLASGIAVSGMGVATAVLVPFTQKMIGTLGWRSAFMVLSGIVFILLFPLTAAFLRHKPHDLGLFPDGASLSAKPRKRTFEAVDRAWAGTEWTLKKAMREYRYWFTLAYSFLVIIPIYVMLIHTMKLLVDAGLPPMSAAWVVATLGLVSSVFKVFWGWLSDRIGREITFTLGAVVLASGISILLLVEAGGPPFLPYLFVLLAGCGWGVTSPIFMSVSADLFQGRSFGLIYGVNEAIVGLGSALGAWLGGYTFDVTGSYHTALLISIAAALASCPLVWLAAPRKVRRARRLIPASEAIIAN
jgi:MFS family permease